MAEFGWYDKALECIEKEDYTQAKEFLEKALEEGQKKLIAIWETSILKEMG